MIKRLLSVLLCFVLVFSILTITETNSKALFVVDDAVMIGIAISVCASILLSVGLGVASGQGSVYADVAEYVLYHLPTDCYNFLVDSANYSIVNGEIVLVCTSGIWNKIKNWVVNNIGGSIPISAHLGDLSSTDLIPLSSGYSGWGRNPNYNDNFAASSYPYRTLDYTQNGIYVSWLPTGQLNIHLSDGVFVKYSDVWGNSQLDPNHQNVIGISSFTTYGTISICTGCKVGSNTYAVNDLGDLPEKKGIQFWYAATSLPASGLSNRALVTFPDGQTGQLTYDLSSHSVKFGNTVICRNVSNYNDYNKYVALTGELLSNVNNGLVDTNVDVNVTEFTKDIETKSVSPALPRNQSVSNDTVVLCPVPGKAVDPENPTVPLTKNQVKQREKRGQETTVIPEVPDMSDKTGQDVGITLVPGRDILNPDTQIPVYNPGIPSVENPGDVTITVTANNDIFPTAGNGTTAVPGEGESVSVNTGEIVSDIAKDIVTPLSPDDVEKGGNRMRLPTMLAHKFPFCIPFDLYNAVAMMFAEAEVPVFDFPISVPSLGISEDIHFDFSKYEDIVKVARWFMCAGWILGLILITKKVIYK